MSQDILLSLIDRDPGQPRQYFDSAKIAELAQTMDAKGLVIPILVRPDGERFTIVHGERRYRAALSLNWQTIMADVRDITPSEARWLSLIENIQRQDLSPIEEARAYQERLTEGITQTELGQRIGKSQSYIAQKLRLLGLPDEVQEAVASDAIKEGHARQLLKLKDADQQSELCQQATVESWTVAQTQVAVDMVKPLTPEEQASLEQYEKTIDNYLSRLQAMSKPPDPDNLLEVAIWAEQRTAYLGTVPMSSLLERQNEYTEIRLRLERAAGQALRLFESGETDAMTEAGFCAIVSLLNPKARVPIMANVIKQLYEVCPGIELTPTSLTMPEETTQEQYKQVGTILAQLAGISGEYVGRHKRAS